MKFSDDDDDDRQRTNCDRKSILEPSVQVSYKLCNLQFLIISSMVIFTIYSHLCLGLLGNFFGRNNTFSLHDLYGHALAHNHRCDEISILVDRFLVIRNFRGHQILCTTYPVNPVTQLI